MLLRRHAFITVVQTAELRDLNDPADTRHQPRKWILFRKAQMGPGSNVSEIGFDGNGHIAAEDNFVII